MKKKQTNKKEPKEFFLQFGFVKWLVFFAVVLLFASKFTNSWFTTFENIFPKKEQHTAKISDGDNTTINNYNKTNITNDYSVNSTKKETNIINLSKKNNPKIPSNKITFPPKSKPVHIESKKCLQKGSVELNNQPAVGAMVIFDDDNALSTKVDSKGKFSIDLPSASEGKQMLVTIEYNSKQYEVNKKICYNRLIIKL